MPSTPSFTHARRLGDFSQGQIVRLGGLVLADDLEVKLAKFYETAGEREPLLIDLQDSGFIDVAALANCVATTLARTEGRRETWFRLPTHQAVLDFLRVWGFPEAIEQATGRTFPSFLIFGEQSRLDSSQTTYTGIGSALDLLEYDPDWNQESQTPRNFFGFLTFSNPARERIQPDVNFASTPRQLSKRWTSPLLQQVLRRHLGDNAPHDDVARVIIYEAIGNAIRHPEATLIQTVSKFTRKERGSHVGSPRPRASQAARLKTEGALRICIWDDGKAIAETLAPVLAAGLSIRRVTLPRYMCDKIYLQLRKFDETVTKTVVVDQGEELSGETSAEAHLLLASLYPGVSRDVDQAVPVVEPLEFAAGSAPATSVPQLPTPGMGLYALTRTVLDQFQGEIFIRSGRYRLVMAIAHDQYRRQYGVRYKAKLTQYPSYFPPFRGNLLTLNLPIRNPPEP